MFVMCKGFEVLVGGPGTISFELELARFSHISEFCTGTYVFLFRQISLFHTKLKMGYIKLN